MESTKNDLVSIIVPVYNVEKYLRQCIESLINQTYKNIEIILVDDGSTDNSGKICDEYAKNDIRIKAIHQPNKGVSAARNNGLEHATGKYITFVDSDDFLESNMYECMINAFKNDDIKVCICGYNEIIEDIKNSIIYDEKLNDINFYSLILNTNYNVYGYLHNKLFLKDDLVNGFDESVSVKEDLLFILKNYNEKTKYKIINKPLYNYRINSNSLSHSKKIDLKKISAMYTDVWVAENVKNENTYKYMYSACHMYYLAKISLNKAEMKKISEKYKKIINKYEKELIKGNQIGLNDKAKMILKKYFLYIYKSLKKYNV